MALRATPTTRTRTTKQEADSTVLASPTKRFFVEMLTRDIALEDALLDLLDNCVDGVLRVAGPHLAKERPYEGYGAEIFFGANEFRIKDNCGGISREIAEQYAFLMGRRDNDKRDNDIPTVGMYGIGMKRAIFKMGRDATVISHHATGSFEVRIPPDWFTKDEVWNLTAHGILPLAKVKGTEIVVQRLLPSVKQSFKSDSDFQGSFVGKLRSHYAYIMHKGFTVTVNGMKVEPRPVRFLIGRKTSGGGPALEPYLYDSTIDGVAVQVTVGFYRPLPSEEEAEAEMDAKRSSDDAGWTIICNDRVVLYCDKTRLTGWGEADVPNFHAQFNAISGVAEFVSKDAMRLPLTTTKRGIDAGADLYLRVKNRMREGTKLFTNYTYKWKQALDEAKRHERDAESVDLSSIRTRIPPAKWKNANDGGHRFMPELPVPDVTRDDVTIRFRKPAAEVRRVGEHLLDDAEAKPGKVGEAAFDQALRKAP